MFEVGKQFVADGVLVDGRFRAIDELIPPNVLHTKTALNEAAAVYTATLAVVHRGERVREDWLFI